MNPDQNRETGHIDVCTIFSKKKKLVSNQLIVCGL